MIEKTFNNIGKVKNVQKPHYLILNSDGTLVVKKYSTSSSSKTYRIFQETNNKYGLS